MKIKRFEAQSMQEAIKQIKETLGPDAVILSVKEIRKGKGILGFLQKAVEVTAAIDIPPEQIKQFKEEREERTHVSSDLIQAMEDLRTEIEELKRYIETFVPNPIEGDKDIFHFCRQIRANGLAADIALKLIEGIKEGLFEEAINKNMNFKEFFCYLLGGLIKVLPPIENIKDEQKIAVFVGPTGTGKTTTLAKIAGNVMKGGKKVGIVNLDTRSFAKEQLRFYASSWNIPLETVSSSKGLIKAVSRLKEKDIIFIDTCGCSPYNEFLLKDIERSLRLLARPSLVYLVLSVTTKEEALLRAVRQFDCLSITSLVFTKLDEGETYGSIFNQMVYTGKPLSYFTMGQRVPEDIEIATPKRVMELVINNLRGDSDVERDVQIS